MVLVTNKAEIIKALEIIIIQIAHDCLYEKKEQKKLVQLRWNSFLCSFSSWMDAMILMCCFNN